jgi:hypothetical protein
VVEEDSGYQEMLCSTLRGGCSQDEFKTWSLYAGGRDEIDDRELRQELLNCAVGPLEDMIYDTLGAKVDSLSEADILDEVGKIATVKTGTQVQAEDHRAVENPVESTLAKENITNMVINPPITEQHHQYPIKIQNQPAPVKSTADTTNKLYNEGHDTKDYTEKVDVPKIMADTNPDTDNPQRAMPYLTEDSSTPDWSESFSSLKLVVVPSVSNITELNLSSSTTDMMEEKWGRPNNTPVDMSKVAKTPMAMRDDPDEDISAEGTEETMENTSKRWTALPTTKPNRNAATTEQTQNSNSTRGPEQDLLLDKTSIKSWHKTNTTLALDGVHTETDEPDTDKEATGTEPDDNTPKANEGAFAATIREVDKHSNEPLTIISGFKKPTNQPHIIDVEDDDKTEEETAEITTMGEFKIPPARPHIIDVESDNSEDETNEPAHTADIPDDWFERFDALPTTPGATTEEAAPIHPHERFHRSRYRSRSAAMSSMTLSPSFS